MEVPQLITDLAILLSTAAVVTIVFKKLRIPSILGYILAGFLISPHFSFFLNISSRESIATWGEIGVVIILFHIGLEFDFHKLNEVGSTAAVSAAVKMGSVMAVGYGFGKLTGMTNMDSVFLGAMLSISSTVVIEKCFSELGIEDEGYTKVVMGSLVMEDVFSVFLMVVLTTVSAGQRTSDIELATHMITMILYLIIWLVVGIFVVPTVLDRTISLMNDETLTLLSIGFCFVMALLAHYLGFSMELGAFVAGSLFAGTRHSHDIERVTAGLKYMFGAIFFLSVGMLVDPVIIATRWTSIVPIAIIAVIAKLMFATIGMMLSGQDLESSLKGGISLAPIGEFSFIIAALGIGLGVIDDYLYPVIVAASILTIMMTPVLIRKQDVIIAFMNRTMPEKFRARLDAYTSEKRNDEAKTSEWKLFFKEYILQFLVYGSIIVVSMLAGIGTGDDLLASVIGRDAAKWVVTIVLYVIIAIFAGPFMGRRSKLFTTLWMTRLSNRPPLVVLTAIKLIALEVVAVMPIMLLFNKGNVLIELLIPLSIVALAKTEFISTYYLKLETRFFANLNQKTMAERGGSRDRELWLNEDYYIFSFTVKEGDSYIGRSIAQLNWGRQYAVYVVKIERGEKRIAMPNARTSLQTGDTLYVIGEKHQLEAFVKILNIQEKMGMRTLKDFLSQGYHDQDSALECAAVKVRGIEPYVGKPIKRSYIISNGNCLILGIERDGYATRMPDANMMIEKGDILWIVGTNKSLSRITAHSVGEAGIHTEAEPAETSEPAEPAETAERA